MNNYRLSTYLNKQKSYSSNNDLIDSYLSLPPIFLKNNQGQIINTNTNELVRDNYVLEVIKLNQSLLYFSTISELLSV